MNRNAAFWIGFFSAFIASGLALRVAFSLALAERTSEFSLGADLAAQSKWAGVAGLAALLSAIAQVIEKAYK